VKPGQRLALWREESVQRPDFISGDSLTEARFSISPQNAAKSTRLTTDYKRDRLAGGGSSLERTVLRSKFPANREKYREFFSFVSEVPAENSL
jgi:hypothetical protein